MKKQYRSRLMASIHQTAMDLHAAGVVKESAMREFDKLCLVGRRLQTKEAPCPDLRGSRKPQRVDE